MDVLLGQFLEQGDNAYVHCVSGISRAPMAAAVMSSMLMGIDFEDAKDIINQTRNVKFEGMHGGQRSMGGPWIDEVLQKGTINAVVPTGFSCRVAHPEQVVVHATASGKDGTGPITVGGRELGKESGRLASGTARPPPSQWRTSSRQPTSSADILHEL